jgi:chemotaxis protein MotB
MARRHKHEDHVNHEAWAIPYGDLITLLLAFFVVMYAMSSVNEGKYRVLSDSLVAAFNGAPRTVDPVQVGEQPRGTALDPQSSLVQQLMVETQPRTSLLPITLGQQASEELANVANEVEQSMSDLIDRELITVRRHGNWVEVEIRTDILFPSGVATLSPAAEQVLQQLAETLKPFPNAIRVEGHTDNRPISTAAFPSNWELSAARAASVVHLFTRAGMDPARLAVIGLAENQPAQSNATLAGRNANRRVLLAILGSSGRPEGDYAGERGQPDVPSTTAPPAIPVALPKPATVEASLAPVGPASAHP